MGKSWRKEASDLAMTSAADTCWTLPTPLQMLCSAKPLHGPPAEALWGQTG